MTKSRPILFSGAMVRALLDGTKTQTRRAAKTPASYKKIGWTCPPDGPVSPPIHWCPYGKIGDTLWVRETWAYRILAMSAERDEDGPYVYAADDPPLDQRLCARWRPSIHMPRVACRIKLEITDVRVERLQDISEADAKAEGWPGTLTSPYAISYPKIWYKQLWQDINGRESWDQNPWVWVIGFKVVT